MKFLELILCLILVFLDGGGNIKNVVSADDDVDGDVVDGDIIDGDVVDGDIIDGDVETLSPAPTAATTSTMTDTSSPTVDDDDDDDDNDDPTPSPIEDDKGGDNSSGDTPADLPSITKFSAVKNDPKTLNIHIVAHTHDDVGWLKTVDQCYFGWNQTIQIANVKSILDTLMIALKEKDYRTFSYVEQRFFSMWWFDHDTAPDVKNSVIQKLLPNHQLIFVNGGWSMHDEACTHYMGMIDQMTTGHAFLKQEFNFIPTVGWQLDPFGHSHTQATLMTSKLGFDAMYFGRISHDELEQRKSTKDTEGLWTGSSHNADSGGDISTIFWGLTGSYKGTYGPPHGYRFDEGSGNPKSADPVLQNMTRDEQIASITSGLLPQIATQASQTNGNHIMLTMGSDFRYQNAPVIFESLDIMIQVSNMIGTSNYNNTMDDLFKDLGYDNIHMFYSNPEYYTEKKYESLSDVTYSPAKTDDFFPYADLHHDTTSYWTGYFTSRTGFKRMERVASSYLMAARQIEATSGLYVEAHHMAPPNSHNSHNGNKQGKCDCGASTFSLEDALGIAQHHDAITGTSKQHVANDYAQRLQRGIHEATGMVLFKLRGLLLEHSQLNRKEVLSDLQYCQLLNETKCQLSIETTTDSDEEKDLYLIVYNSLAHPRSTVIRLPVGREDVFSIQKVLEKTDADDPSAPNMTPPKLVQSVSSDKDSSNFDEGASYVLYFDTGDLPPIGSSVFRIRNNSNNNRRRKMQNHYDDDPTPSPVDDNDAADPTPAPESDSSDNSSSAGPSSGSSSSTDPPTATPAAPVNSVTLSDVTSAGHIIASNGKLNIHFDSNTGEIIEVGKDDEDTFSMQISQTWGYYESYNEEGKREQRSGAYIFRPSEPDQEPIVANPTSATFVEAGDAIEVHVDYDLDWIHQVFRLDANQDYVEIDYTIGPIPIDDGIGKEIVTRYKTDIDNDKICYTDSNGREFQKRTYNPDTVEPVAGNYYPVNTAIYAEDDLSSLSIVTDRTQGGACLGDGTIELMVQRRILGEDSRGVGEALNETTLGVTPYPPYGDATRQGTGIIIRGKHRLLVGLGNHGASLARSAMDGAFAEPLVFVGTSPSTSPDPMFRSGTAGASAAGISAALPDNVMLLTFSRMNTFLFLVRIGHQYGHEEEPVLSKPKMVDMESLFDGYKIKDMMEMTLSANQKYQDWADRRMDWASEGNLPPGIVDGVGANTLIRLRPMDIRTFIIEIEPSHGAHTPDHKDIKKKNTNDNVVSTVVPAVVLAFLLIVIGLIVYASRHQRYREFENVVAAAEKDCNYKYDLELTPYAPPIS